MKTYGIRIAAVTTYISMFFITVAGFYYKQYQEIKKLNLYPLRWFTTSTLVLIIFYFIKDVDIQSKIFISIGLIFSFIMLYIFARKKDYLKNLENV